MSQQHVYFIEGGGLTKIGVAVNPRLRLGLLQVGSPVKLTIKAVAPGGKFAETALHMKFAAQRHHGEWFSTTLGLVAVIAHVSANGALPEAILSEAKVLQEADLLRPRITPEKVALIELAAKRLGVGVESLKKWKLRGHVPYKWRFPIIQQTGGAIAMGDFDTKLLKKARESAA